jgi:hypothetical protein
LPGNMFAVSTTTGGVPLWLPCSPWNAKYLRFIGVAPRTRANVARATENLLASAGGVSVWTWYRGRSRRAEHSLGSIIQPLIGAELAFVVTLLCWAILPVLASWGVSQGATRVFSTRYLVIIVPALCLLSGVVISAIRIAPARAIVIAGLLIPALIGGFTYYPRAQVEDWRTPTRWIEQHYQPGDGLVSYNNVQGAQFAIQYYLHSDGSPVDFDAASPGVTIWERLPGADPFGGFQAALDPQALATYAAEHQRIFFISGRLSGPDDGAAVQTTTAWLESHYHLVSQSNVGAATVWLYSTQ